MNLEQIFIELDCWVSGVGNGGYMPSELVTPLPYLQVLPDFGIQQVKLELVDLCNTIVNQPWYSQEATALEIGLGHYGSTHFLWRHLFGKTTTIEKNHDRVNTFSHNTGKFYKKWVLGDGRSSFVIGPSSDPVSVEKVYETCDKVDFLFIDGDHSYKSVLADWLIYSPLVRQGGMIVFHDTNLSEENGGVIRLIDELRSGRFDKKYNIKDIIHSQSVGISYYVKEYL